MRINELPLVENFDGIEGRICILGVVFFYIPGIPYTWRGINQTCPANAQIVGNADVICFICKLGMQLVAVRLHKVPGYKNFESNWYEPNLFDSHKAIIKTDRTTPESAEEPTAVWFERV